MINIKGIKINKVYRNINNIISIRTYNIKLKGNTLLLTMFIMAGMIIVASSGSYLALLAIRAGTIQSQSTKAYFVAETGAEKLLYELRQKNEYSPSLTPNPNVSVFENDPSDLELGGNYNVYQIEGSNLVWLSAGEFITTKRGVEIDI